MSGPRVVLDTNVIIAARRSQRGASSKVVGLLGTDSFDAYLSVALALEYEAVLMRQRLQIGLREEDVSRLANALCAVSIYEPQIYFRWRPTLRDAKDGNGA